MLEALIAALIIVAVSIALLAAKSLLGKGDFRISDVGDSAALQDKGICCPRKQDEMARRNSGFAVEEHTHK